MTGTRTRYFHEDDYCQQEFLPLSAWAHCASQVAAIDAFSEAHRTEHGWTDMYVRPPAPSALADLGITAADVAAVVASVLVPFAGVTTGYGSHVEACPKVSAYGMEHGVTLFAECNARGTISALWLDPGAPAPAEVHRVVDVLSGLPKAQELLFVDWAWSRLFKAADKPAWVAYFDEHGEAAQK